MPLSDAILLKMDSSVILFYSLHENFEILTPNAKNQLEPADAIS